MEKGRTEMRIVGLNINSIIIQKKNKGGWTQARMSLKEFEQMMREEFPDYMAEYDGFIEGGEHEMALFFYNYGEADSEKTYIFR